MVAEAKQVSVQSRSPEANQDDESEAEYHPHNRTMRVCAIIPAYNEARRIRQLLSVLQQTDCLSKIIVVDDGSSDGTDSIVQAIANEDCHIQPVTHRRNFGKGDALYTGASLCLGDQNAVLTLDADLTCLTPEHIRDLVTPVLNGQADMTLGLFIGGKWNTDLAHRLTPWLTGQRCFRMEILEYLDWNAASGYGLETALMFTTSKLDWRIQNVYLKGVSHPPSEFHHGLVKGASNRVKMYWQIGRAWWLLRRSGKE